MIAPEPGFRPFGMDHALALAWTLPLIAGSCWLGRRWRRGGETGTDPHGLVKEQMLARAWGVLVIIINVLSIAYWLVPSRFDLKTSLPLHLCDVACLTTPWVFLSGARTPRALIYFWGVGLSTQAFLTPTLTEGYETQRYWLFWLVHLAIVGSAAYEIIVRRFRPTAADLWKSIAVTTTWYASMFVLNIPVGSNYGYVGRSSPTSPTIIDHLGPWPWRVLVLAVIATSLFVALWAVWLLPRLWRRPAQADPNVR